MGEMSGSVGIYWRDLPEIYGCLGELGGNCKTPEVVGSFESIMEIMGLGYKRLIHGQKQPLGDY